MVARVFQHPASGPIETKGRRPWLFLPTPIHTWNNSLLTSYLAYCGICSGTPYLALLDMDVQTGLRRSELLRLRWRDVDLSTKTLHVISSLHRLNDDFYRRNGKGMANHRLARKSRGF